VAEDIGCSPELLQEAAQWLGQAKRPAFICSPPLGQGSNGVEQITALANLAVLCGAFSGGKGFHWVGPQSNMVGAVEMGAAPALLPGYASAKGKGLSAGEQFQTAAKGKLKALFVVGEDPLNTLPRGMVEEGLKSLEFLVVQDMFLSETAERAHVFLPALSFAETDGTFTNCEGRVQRLQRAVDPPEGLRWGGEVFADVASFMGKEMPVVAPSGVFAEISETNPVYKGMAFDPQAPQRRAGSGGDLLKKAAFSVPKTEQEQGEKDYPFSLSIEGIFSSHLIGSGVQKTAPGLAQVSRSSLELNVEEARKIDVADGERVRVITPWGETEVTVTVSEGMRKDCLCLFLPLHDVAIAQLVGPQVDRRSLVPTYAGIPARIEKVKKS